MPSERTMANGNERVLVGTVGEGLYISDDGGATFKRPANNGLYIEGEVRSLAAHPERPNRIFAGTHAGVYRSDDGGDTWQRLSSAMDGLQVWALMVLPADPDTVFAGTRPAGVYRSTDGGDTWQDAQLGASTECPVIEFTRITTIIPDPVAPRSVWVGVEIDGAFRSDDAGDTWSRHADGLSSLDVHGMVVVPDNGSRTLVAATNNGVNVSADEGASWQRQDLGAVAPWSYFRGIRQQAGRPGTIFLGHGNGPPGSEGAVLRSRDGGASWQRMALPVDPNSTIWDYATHAADPDLVYAYTCSGELYRSADGGDRWDKLRHEFGEIRALMWTPA